METTIKIDIIKNLNALALVDGATIDDKCETIEYWMDDVAGVCVTAYHRGGLLIIETDGCLYDVATELKKIGIN